jgi:hypothetical protein
VTTASFAPGRVADRVQERAQKYDPKRLLVILVMALPFMLGWVAAKLSRAVWMVGTWVFAAVAEGWASAWPAENRRR